MSRTVLLTLTCLLAFVFPAVAHDEPATEKQPQRKANPTQRRPPPVPRDVEGVEHFRIQSKLLTEFWGCPMYIDAGVILPLEHDKAKKITPACYSIHGFGGSHSIAWRMGKRLRDMMAKGHPPMLYVFLNAQFSLGHHEFADSVNNGPWGQALIEEFIPAFEEEFGAAPTADGRFLTGHSSGGWSSMWLQVTYPEQFAGTWSTAPDSIDFRDFTGINVYQHRNAYTDPEGNPVQLVRNGKGEWVRTIKEYAQGEAAKSDFGGQFASFDAVFSPRDIDGRPMKMFDRETGDINDKVRDHWRKYDIVLKIRDNWSELKDKLSGKLHVYVGTYDTFRLEGAVLLAQAELKKLGSDAEFVIVEKRTHGSLMAPHETLWPKGLLPAIHQKMWAQWEARTDESSP